MSVATYVGLLIALRIGTGEAMVKDITITNKPRGGRSSGMWMER